MANKGHGLESEQKRLCNRCKSIPAITFFSSGKPRIEPEYKLGPRKSYQLIKGSNAFKKLKLSAAAGCGLCKLFQDALELSSYHPDEQLRRQPECCKDGIWLKKHISNNLAITFGFLCHHRLDAWLTILTDQSTTRSIEPDAYVTETESDSPANFALARSWLAECTEDHVDCRDLLEFELPRRLLEVAVPFKPGIVRLVSVLDLPTKARADYAALSHCWGFFQPLQTKRENLPSHMQEIPDTQLPQTFLDAARTTRELGLRYLWIDSLCIVQDNPSDIEAECAPMNTIFANALCAISASDARDCRDGLFQSRMMKPIELTYESEGFEPKLIVLMQPAFSKLWIQGLQGPLQSRAWVLQERHLPPRVIHYTNKCLMWECRSAIASEHRPKMEAKARNGYGGHGFVSNRFLDGGRTTLRPEDTQSHLRNDKFRSLHGRWYRIVEEYSHRVLSHPEDKLPALSGFAAEWKRIKPDDEYFAGLWKSDIFAGLAWFPSSALQLEDTMHRQPTSDITRHQPESNATWPPLNPFKGMPSWSWAAFDGPVAHFGKDWFSTSCNSDLGSLEVELQLSSPSSWSLRLHDVTTTIEQRNPFGRVSKGVITVSSWSIVVTLSESDFSPISLFAIGEAPKAYRLHPDLQYVFDGMVYFDHDPFYLPKIQLRLLQLGQGTAIHGSKARVCGLALLQLETGELTSNQDFYRRVGMFDLGDHAFWLLRREWKAITII